MTEEKPVKNPDFDNVLVTEDQKLQFLPWRAKIIEEQIKLLKLKQELARITAEISVAENQIEYYNLMLQSTDEP